jgi:hypothetical protein
MRGTLENDIRRRLERHRDRVLEHGYLADLDAIVATITEDLDARVQEELKIHREIERKNRRDNLLILVGGVLAIFLAPWYPKRSGSPCRRVSPWP